MLRNQATTAFLDDLSYQRCLADLARALDHHDPRVLQCLQDARLQLEGFVAGELRRQLAWAEEPVRTSHFRDRSAGEVDLILETPDPTGEAPGP